ncbi:MAG TPA: DUF2922 domain-containing protein [Syntrophomonadaceae bacterium]|jgi:hypothetical protein|nr:DUF2922 domain-containing protein [Syntrophomonadaceae bacterium]
MNKVLEMSFSTELGRTQRIRVYDAREDLTPAEIGSTMDEIIARNIFSSSGGQITGKVSARLVTTTVEEFDLV